MKAYVDGDVCIGCGLCADSCPDIFELVDDKAVVKVSPIPKDYEDLVKEARENCPVDAIRVEE